MVAVLPADHPWAGRKTFPIERYAEEPFIEVYPGEDCDNARTLAACGVKPRPRYTVRDGMRLWLNASEYLASGTETAQWLAGLLEKDETSYLREALKNENPKY